jgi:diadenosine tetraphosphate (Ap4A) HIT family hydrolase/5-methylcytosine-specific restriction endonuclease McrA
MEFAALRHFISERMRMSHVYQPLMLLTLLKGRGRATIREIARAILARDQSQIEYYEQITKNMVGRVLRSHGVVERQGEAFRLVDFDQLSETEVEQLVSLCVAKLEAYEEARAGRMWSHRKRSGSLVSGTLRYEVLKRARFRCELCGVSAEVKALEVDHILPRSRKGTDDLENLQALCYSCNAMKRDRDDMDFRPWKAEYDHRESGCLFCGSGRDRPIVAENALAYAIRDGFPVTPLHTLVIPKRHVVDYFGLTRSEWGACDSLVRQQRAAILEIDGSVTGFNVGTNAGAVAGQTVMHAHVHLIPRRAGDVERPRGGVRHAIPGKGSY